MLAIVGLVVLLVLMKSCNHDTTSGQPTLGGGEPLTDIERAATGIEADTPQDTVATLVNEVRVMKEQLATLEGDNKDLINMEGTLKRRMSNELAAQKSELERKHQAAMLQQEERFARMMNDQKGGKPTGYNHSNTPNGERVGDTYWVEPIGSTAKPAGAVASLGNLGERLGISGSTDEIRERSQRLFSTNGARANDVPPIEPVFTIAKNSTLVNSTAMTALIGRVPIGGNVSDPYFFKVIIGKENLIANGVELPEVAYAVASGDAFGDWTLSCVRGTVYSMTFVFEDGTIRTFPKPEDVYDSNQSEERVALGQLSDAFGNPCVPGKKKTNAGKYLAGRITASAAEAAAIAAAASQTTELQSIGGGSIGSSTSVTGDRGKFIYNSTLAGAARETADWIRERQEQEFDAVYVRAGEKVAVHINEEITLDYDPVGRKVNYDRQTGRAYRELD
jgi:cell division protein ZapB